nr:RNA-directed DNA polymerase, eukaryota, reverse transcriptase zinc-binding domain protein [Tanacetum cinerariifolium]
MAKVKGWDPILDKFKKQLSKWKASLLSIGGRSTLISSVLGSIGTYYFSLFPMPFKVNKMLESIRSNFLWGSDVDVKKISWIPWKSALASKENGGLGIGSLYSLNHALIKKWRWHFFKNPTALWVQNNEWFWDWSRPITRGTLANHFQSLQRLMENITLNDADDIWTWSLGNSFFTVKDTHMHIDQYTLLNAHYFGIVFSLGWTYKFLSHPSYMTSSIGLMTRGFPLLKKLFWKLYVEPFYGPCGTFGMRRFLVILPLVIAFCLIRLLIILIGGTLIETIPLSSLGAVGSKTL